MPGCTLLEASLVEFVSLSKVGPEILWDGRGRGDALLAEDWRGLRRVIYFDGRRWL